MSEKWLPVLGYEGLYEVSNLGRIRSYPRQGTDGRIINILPSKKCGYMRVSLYRDGRRAAKKVHRLVLEAFVGPCPAGMEGCHNNGVRDDNQDSNLRWASRRDNCADAKLHGTAAMGEKNGSAKLSRVKVDKIRKLRASGHTYRSIAESFNVSIDTARSAAVGDTWAS